MGKVLRSWKYPHCWHFYEPKDLWDFCLQPFDVLLRTANSSGKETGIWDAGGPVCHSGIQSRQLYVCHRVSWPPHFSCLYSLLPHQRPAYRSTSRKIEHYKKYWEEREIIWQLWQIKKYMGGPYWSNFYIITKANGKRILIWQMSESCWYNVKFLRNVNKS